MLNVSDEVKTLFLKDSTKKKIEIEVKASDSSNPNELNFYLGTFGYQEYATTIAEGLSPITVEDFTDAVDMRLIQHVSYVRLGMGFRVQNITTAPSTLTFRCYVERTNGTTEYKDVDVTLNDYLNNFHYCPCAVFDAKNSNGYITQITDVQIINGDSTAFVGTITMWNYQVDMVNAALDFPSTFNENYSKNVDDLSDYIPQPNIDNDNIEFESFSLTESLCSQDNIKFGLCESAHCEFTTIGYNHDLKGRVIRPSIRVQGTPSYEDLMDINWWYDQAHIVPIGQTFHDNKTVNGSYHWTSHYLFYTNISQYDRYFSQAPRVMSGYKIRINSLTSLSGTAPYSFQVGIRYVYADGTEQNRHGSTKHPYTEASDFKFYSVESLYNSLDHGKIVQVKRPYFIWFDQNGNELTSEDSFQIDADLKEFMVYMYDDPTYTHYPDYDPSVCYVYYGTIKEHLAECYSDPVSLGVFHVTDVKLEHKQNLIKQQVTAYDNIVKLEQNAYNWYTQYMFGYNTEDYVFQTYRDVQYGRQIFAAYFNFMEQIGLENRNNYTETLIAFYDYWNDIKNTSHVSNKYLKFSNDAASYSTVRNQYAVFQINDIDSDKMYMVDAVNYEGWDDEAVLDDVVSAYESWDSLKRGIVTNGGVLVEMYDSSNNLLDSFCFNRRDYFMIVPNTSYIKVYVPLFSVFYDGELNQRFIDSVSIYSIDSAPQLVNGFERLLYYKYVNQYAPNDTAIVNNSNSSITGRDVVRSLLEPCGCFFRLNRSTGEPEFIYCTKSGLYPRNDLYPAEDLYPRAGTDSLLANGRYMSVIQDNYQVKDFGKIQIVVNTNSNETRPVCQMEYTGSNESPNTYLIDDNIFYSNENMDYEYQRAYTLLSRMYAMISNMGYVPNVTVALGMPWIECGDRVGVLTYIGGFESFIFRRTMKGIQLIEDTFEAVGDEYNEAVKEFGYETYN